MKIAVLSSHTPSFFWFRIDMMRDFISRGHEVLAVGNEPEREWNNKFGGGIKYRQASIYRNGTNPIRDIQTLMSLGRILREEQPDKIFAYQAKTIIYGGIAANRMGITEVYPMIAGVGSVFLSDSLKARTIQFIMQNEYRIAMRKCPSIFFQNSYNAGVFIKRNMVDKDRVVFINGSGVNLDVFSVQPLPDAFGFLCIARLIRDKGIYEYLEACSIVKKEYPQVRCMLVGPYDSNPSAMKEEEIRPYIEDGVIEFFGEQYDVRPYIAQCSVYVLPSYYGEGTPKTVLEAMASGRAIITSDAPGCRETVVDGENGFIVPVKNINALANRMRACIKATETVRRMARASRRMAEDKFDVRSINQIISTTMRL